jgi:hypothetical protein
MTAVSRIRKQNSHLAANPQQGHNLIAGSGRPGLEKSIYDLQPGLGGVLSGKPGVWMVGDDMSDFMPYNDCQLVRVFSHLQKPAGDLDVSSRQGKGVHGVVLIIDSHFPCLVDISRGNNAQDPIRDEVDGDDVIEYFRKDEDKDTGRNCQQRLKGKMKGHVKPLCCLKFVVKID